MAATELPSPVPTETTPATQDSFVGIAEEAIEQSSRGLESHKMRQSRNDALSHKIIEKRRRDRMNNCLADLSRLIPACYLKQGQNRVEKTEIIELAIRHILTLNSQLRRCQALLGQSFPTDQSPCCSGQFLMGYRECTSEALRYLVEKEGFSAQDVLCANLRDHLRTAHQEYTPNVSNAKMEEVQHSFSDITPPASLSSAYSNSLKPGVQPTTITMSSSDNGSSDGRLVIAMGSEASSTANGAVGSVNSTSVARGEFEMIDAGPAVVTENAAVDKPQDLSTRSRSFRPISSDELKIDKSDELPKRGCGVGGPEADEKMYDRPNSTSSCSSDMDRIEVDAQSGDGQKASDLALLPGFVLHLNGTHYVPMVLSPRQLQPAIDSSENGTGDGDGGVYHPISIPVSFQAPFKVARRFGNSISSVDMEQMDNYPFKRRKLGDDETEDVGNATAPPQ